MYEKGYLGNVQYNCMLLYIFRILSMNSLIWASQFWPYLKCFICISLWKRKNCKVVFLVDLKIINISKSLKSIYMYGCILSLNILSKLNKHKGLEFLEGKSSFSRHFLVNAHFHFSDHKPHPTILWNHPPITSTNLRGSLQSIEFIWI